MGPSPLLPEEQTTVQSQDIKMTSYLWTPIHREGWPFVVLFAVAAVLLGQLWEPLGWVGAVATIWCAYFFRDPDRVTPEGESLVVSPCDGVVRSVSPAVPPPELGMGDAPLPCVSVFMSVFDVHVNRVPADGTVVSTAYTPGQFLNAALDKASQDNERMAVRMTAKDGQDIAFVQIAGLVARRIKCDLVQGQGVLAGQRYGLIRFGSRVDVYLPDGVAPAVACGQLALAGETVLADLAGPQIPRLGVVR